LKKNHNSSLLNTNEDHNPSNNNFLLVKDNFAPLKAHKNPLSVLLNVHPFDKLMSPHLNDPLVILDRPHLLIFKKSWLQKINVSSPKTQNVENETKKLPKWFINLPLLYLQ
jgi:hypothetical protein